MPKVSKSTVKSWFQQYDKPTESQFSDTWDSFWHKDEMIPTAKIEEFNAAVNAIIEASEGIVRTTGDQTVNGTKTFGTTIQLPASAPTLPVHATNKAYVDGLVGDLQEQINDMDTDFEWSTNNW